jgi:hypothetical protein
MPAEFNKNIGVDAACFGDIHIVSGAIWHRFHCDGGWGIAHRLKQSFDIVRGHFDGAFGVDGAADGASAGDIGTVSILPAGAIQVHQISGYGGQTGRTNLVKVAGDRIACLGDRNPVIPQGQNGRYYNQQNNPHTFI